MARYDAEAIERRNAAEREAKAADIMDLMGSYGPDLGGAFVKLEYGPHSSPEAVEEARLEFFTAITDQITRPVQVDNQRRIRGRSLMALDDYFQRRFGKSVSIDISDSNPVVGAGS